MTQQDIKTACNSIQASDELVKFIKEAAIQKLRDIKHKNAMMNRNYRSIGRRTRYKAKQK